MGLSRYVLDKPVFSCFEQLFLGKRVKTHGKAHILCVNVYLEYGDGRFHVLLPFREGSNLSPNAYPNHDTLAVVWVTL